MVTVMLTRVMGLTKAVANVREMVLQTTEGRGVTYFLISAGTRKIPWAAAKVLPNAQRPLLAVFDT